MSVRGGAPEIVTIFIRDHRKRYILRHPGVHQPFKEPKRAKAKLIFFLRLRALRFARQTETLVARDVRIGRGTG